MGSRNSCRWIEGNSECGGRPWECQDRSLYIDKTGQMCGETDHLKSFALLLGAGIGSSDPYFFQSSIAWVSLGLLLKAIAMVLLGNGAVELRYYRRRKIQSKQFRALESRMASDQQM